MGCGEGEGGCEGEGEGAGVGKGEGFSIDLEREGGIEVGAVVVEEEFEDWEVEEEGLEGEEVSKCCEDNESV